MCMGMLSRLVHIVILILAHTVIRTSVVLCVDL